MAIAFDTFSGGSINSNSLTVSHTCGSLTNGFLVVSVSANGSSGDQISGVTYNGVAMTRAVAHQLAGLGVWSYLYFLYNPPSGAHNVVVSASGTFVIRCANGSYSGVKQSLQPDATGSGEANPGTTVTAAVTVVNSNCWMISAVQNDSALAETVGGVLTSNRGNDGNNVLTLGDSNGVIGTGSQNATWTSGSQKLDAVALSLIAFGASQAGTMTTNTKYWGT